LDSQGAEGYTCFRDIPREKRLLYTRERGKYEQRDSKNDFFVSVKLRDQGVSEALLLSYRCSHERGRSQYGW